MSGNAKRRAAAPRLKVVAPAALPTKLRWGTGEEEGFAKIDGWRALRDYGDGSVEQLFCPGVFHRLAQDERFAMMNEAWRVLKLGERIGLVVPYWSSDIAIADPLAQWPPLCEKSFFVYSKSWREANECSGLSLTCNFGTPGGMSPHCGHVPTPLVAPFAEERRSHYAAHNLNAVQELHVWMTKLS